MVTRARATTRADLGFEKYHSITVTDSMPTGGVDPISSFAGVRPMRRQFPLPVTRRSPLPKWIFCGVGDTAPTFHSTFGFASGIGFLTRFFMLLPPSKSLGTPEGSAPANDASGARRGRSDSR